MNTRLSMFDLAKPDNRPGPGQHPEFDRWMVQQFSDDWKERFLRSLMNDDQFRDAVRYLLRENAP